MQDIDSIRNAYDAVASAYAQLIPAAGSAAGPEADEELILIREFAGSLDQGADVLDAGCGAGRMIAYLEELAAGAGRSLAVQGCDLSGEMVALARQAHPGRRILPADLCALPYAAQAFDGVLAWYSLIHTPPEDLAVPFAEFRRVMRPGGVLLLGFHAGAGQRVITNAYGQGVEMTAYLHPVSEVLSGLRDCGFRELAVLDRKPAAGEQQYQGFVLAAG